MGSNFALKQSAAAFVFQIILHLSEFWICIRKLFFLWTFKFINNPFRVRSSLEKVSPLESQSCRYFDEKILGFGNLNDKEAKTAKSVLWCDGESFSRFVNFIEPIRPIALIDLILIPFEEYLLMICIWTNEWAINRANYCLFAVWWQLIKLSNILIKMSRSYQE